MPNSKNYLVLEGKVDGKRNRGRPQRRWVDNIKEWLQTSVGKAGRLDQDRDAYRSSGWAATRRETSFNTDSTGGGSQGLLTW